METTLSLETERLLFRRLTKDDVPLLMGIFADRVAMRHWPGTKSVEEVEAWIERMQELYAEPGMGFHALTRKSNGEFVGQAGMTWRSVDGGKIREIGYQVVRGLWGLGFATEAGRALRDYAFRELHDDQVSAWMPPAHLQSRRVAEKAGMALWREVDGSNGPMMVYRITRAEWVSEKNADFSADSL